MEHFLSSLKAFCGKSFVKGKRVLRRSWLRTWVLYRAPERAEATIIHFVSKEQVAQLFEVFDLAPVMRPGSNKLSYQTLDGNPANIEWLIVMWQTAHLRKHLQEYRKMCYQRNIEYASDA